MRVLEKNGHGDSDTDKDIAQRQWSKRVERSNQGEGLLSQTDARNESLSYSRHRTTRHLVSLCARQWLSADLSGSVQNNSALGPKSAEGLRAPTGMADKPDFFEVEGWIAGQLLR